MDSKNHRGDVAIRPALVPSSFRGLPEVMGPLNKYLEVQRRSFNSQLDIIFDNALAHKAQVGSQAMDVLLGKEKWVAASEVAPKSFRVEEGKLELIRRSASECGVGLSDWVNMAIFFCLNNDLMEPSTVRG